MNFEALKRRVQRAEQLADRRLDQARGQRAQLRQAWREAWSPGRIVVIGLLGGFLLAKARPLRALGAVSGTRWLQLATSLSGLFASLKAARAAESADTSAGSAEAAAVDAAQAVDAAVEPAVVAVATTPDGIAATQTAAEDAPRPLPDRRRPDAQWDTPPRPAEAATELSER